MMLSKESIFVWLFKSYPKNRKKYLALMQNPDYQHIRFMLLLCSFLKSLIFAPHFQPHEKNPWTSAEILLNFRQQLIWVNCFLHKLIAISELFEANLRLHCNSSTLISMLPYFFELHVITVLLNNYNYMTTKYQTVNL